MRKRVISGIVAALLVVLAALWFSDTLRIPTDGPSFAGGSEIVKTREATDPGVESNEPLRRALNPAQPLKLWIGGDSLAGALGPALGEMTATTGIVQPQYDFRVGSGLMSGDRDWIERGQEEMDELNPEVVVFVIGTNDAQVYADRDAVKYEQLTEQMMRILVGDGREVYWVNAPVMEDEDLEENVLKIDEIQRRVADRVEGVTFVDAHTLFADEAGEYVSSLPDETGDNVSMRAGDGIHLSGDGALHLARAIFMLIDPIWRIGQQQVAGQTKEIIVSRGSDSLSGGSGSGSNDWDDESSWNSNSSSNGSGNGNTSSETAPTTAATVAPPPPPSTQPTVATTSPTTPATVPPPSP